jgi:hypothetical protein
MGETITRETFGEASEEGDHPGRSRCFPEAPEENIEIGLAYSFGEAAPTRFPRAGRGPSTQGHGKNRL